MAPRRHWALARVALVAGIFQHLASRDRVRFTDRHVGEQALAVCADHIGVDRMHHCGHAFRLLC
jgi:hypothetical protein